MTKDRRSEDPQAEKDEKPNLTPFHPPKTREGDEEEGLGTLVRVDVEDDKGGGSEVM